MKEETIAEILNTVLVSIGVLVVFFAGYMIALDSNDFTLGFFLFIVGAFLSVAVKFVPKEEKENDKG